MTLLPSGRMDAPARTRPTAQPMKPQICNLIRPTLSTRKMATMTPKTNSTSIMAEHLPQNVVMDCVRQLVRLRLLDDDGRQNRRCENTDAVDTKVLQEPRNRGQGRRATVF